MQPEIRVRVYALDTELRAWVADELMLMSPTIEVQTSNSMAAVDASPAATLVIVGLEALSLADAGLLRELVDRCTTPVIAIGTPSSVLASAPFASILDTKLTSKQFKHAVRETLAGELLPTA